MVAEKLFAGLAKLGISMFEHEGTLDLNETLAEVVKSYDTRLWESFPVMLANAEERYAFEPEKVEQYLTSQNQKDVFRYLMLFSGALFSLYHLSFSWWQRLKAQLSKEQKVLVKTWKDDLAHDRTLVWQEVKIDAERAKRLFELYFEKRAEKNRRQKERFEEMSLEYALSQIFSSKQKELFKKKLDGLPLTKTEQEYYSRTVKKKVLALANVDLHSLSKKLLGL